MYERYYGLKEKPFQLPPDPEYVFMSETHLEVFTHLKYAVQENKGFVVITGEIGAGKTTLMNVLLEKIPQDVETAVITQTNLEPREFLRRLCDEFEVGRRAVDKAQMLDALHSFLLDQYRLGRRVVLIVDESQNLPLPTIEELRMLSNLELEKEHLLQMILLGQPDLKDKLRRKELEQFSQRVSVHCHLTGLEKAETDKYIRHRLKVAGARRLDLFTKGAVDSIFEASKGIPRLINILCDAALLYGYADDLPVIDRDVIIQVVEERQDLVTETTKRPPDGALTDAYRDQITERMDTLEGHLKRLYALIDNHIKGQEDHDKDFEARILEQVRDLIEGKGNNHEPEADDLDPALENDVHYEGADGYEEEVERGFFSRFFGRVFGTR